MNPYLKKCVAWCPALSWAGLIFFLSTRPASGLPAPWFLAHDKLVHAGVYGVLSLTVYFALRKGHHRTPCTAALMGTLFASLYGLSDEVHQMFTPSRVADLWDWAADTAGAACVFLLTLLPSRHEPSR
jgi:VanZ family protein